MSPFADIGLMFEASGFNQGLNAGSEHFVGNAEAALLALLYSIADHARHFMPARRNDREDDLIDLRLGKSLKNRLQ
nr:hypothetical protein [Bradyrhizobium australiense]